MNKATWEMWLNCGDTACKHATLSSYSLCNLTAVTGLLCMLNHWQENTHTPAEMSTFGYMHAGMLEVGLTEVPLNI